LVIGFCGYGVAAGQTRVKIWPTTEVTALDVAEVGVALALDDGACELGVGDDEDLALDDGDRDFEVAGASLGPDDGAGELGAGDEELGAGGGEELALDEEAGELGAGAALGLDDGADELLAGDDEADELGARARVAGPDADVGAGIWPGVRAGEAGLVDGFVGVVADVGPLGAAAGTPDDGGKLNRVSGTRPSMTVFGTVRAELLTVSDTPRPASQRYPLAADMPPARTLIDTRNDRFRMLNGDTGWKTITKV
jgi:hypothetical protein